jgi:hypothetical protein
MLRSRPVFGRDPENFSGRDLEIFQKIYQDIQLDESNLKFSIGPRTTFGSRPKKLQPGRLIPVATVNGSRSDIFLGRDPEKSLGRDLDRVEVPNTNFDVDSSIFFKTLIYFKCKSKTLIFVIKF